jgi:AcrR family transcriptional regulator
MATGDRDEPSGGGGRGQRGARRKEQADQAERGRAQRDARRIEQAERAERGRAQREARRNEQADQRRGDHSHAHTTGESLRDLVVSKLAEKAAEHDRGHRQGRKQAGARGGRDERPDVLDLWTRMPPRGRRPRLNRDELAATAVRIADREGLAALSMRRLAGELGAGTMSLYYYVRTKTELLTLVVDTVMAENHVPDGEMPEDWQDALVAIALVTRATLRRHPWVMEIAEDPPIGPNSIRHFDQSLQAVSGLDAPLADKLDLVLLVDEYVFGVGFLDRQAVDVDAQAREQLPYIEALLETGAFPYIEAMVEEHGMDAGWATFGQVVADEGRFERNLRRLLAGVAADLERAGRHRE